MKKISLFLGCIFILIITFFCFKTKKNSNIKPHVFQKDISKINYIDKHFIVFNNNESSYIYDFTNNNIDLLSNNDKQIVKVFSNKKIVYLKNGELYLNEKKIDEIDNIKSISFKDDLFVINSNDKFGVLDSNLNIIIPFEYDNIQIGEQLFLAKLKDKIGYINKQNNIIIPFEYEAGTSDENNKIIVLKKNKAGILNIKNDKITNFIYDNFMKFSNKFVGYKDNKFFLLDENTNKELDATWVGFPSKNTIFYEKNGKFGLLDINGNKITENIYDELGQQNIEAIIFKKDNKYGLINQKGEVIYKNTADYIVPLSKYFYIAGKDGEDTNFIINSDGKSILKNENFIEIFEINENYLLAQTLDDFTLFDKNGTNLLTIKEIIFFNNSIIIYKKDNQIFYIKF